MVIKKIGRIPRVFKFWILARTSIYIGLRTLFSTIELTACFFGKLYLDWSPHIYSFHGATHKKPKLADTKIIVDIPVACNHGIDRF